MKIKLFKKISKDKLTYLLLCLTFSLYLDTARNYDQDIVGLLIIRMQEIINFVPERYALFTFFLILYITALTLDTILIDKNKNYSPFIKSIKETAISFLSLLINLYFLKGLFFSYRFLIFYFLLFFTFIFTCNKFINKKIFSPIYAITTFIFLNTLFMFMNFKPDSQIFENLFENRRVITKSWTSSLQNSNIEYFTISCCTSENYIESGLKPGGFLNIHDNDVLFVNGKGYFYKIKNSQLGNFVSITTEMKTNFYSFVDEAKFNSLNKLSIRGTLIKSNSIFVSFINEPKKDCYNLEILKGKIEEKEIIFEKFYDYKECNIIPDISNSQLHSSSGAMVSDYDYLYLAVGEFLNSKNSQTEKNPFGKVLKIDLKTKDSQIVSMGHRNIQGMEIVNSNILSVEHGPKGGDELNIIKTKYDIQNFGWPISSYGEHYDGRTDDKDMPLYKSHKDYGYIEPKLYFTPSIGISDVKFHKNKIIISSMKSGRLYILDESAEGNVYDANHIKINRRIRDILILDNKLILFLEDLSGIAILDL